MKVDKTIDSVVKDGLCTGCGTCVGLCPLLAIEMVINDSKGIYIPRLDEEKCNQCGICFEVCPGHTVDFKQLNSEIFGKQPEDILLGNYFDCYISHATDYDIRYNSASGGLVTALLTFALEEGIIDGALVTKMRDDRPLEPQPFIATTGEEIISAAKSKYCPVPANIVLKSILEQDGRFAVVGLPCHIHGIRKAQAVNKKLKERIALHLGLFCSASDSFWLNEFISWKYGIKKEDVTQLHYRGQGWPGYMTIHFKNGARKLIPVDDWIIFHGSGFTRRRCTLCCDMTSEFADISFGDAWRLPESAQDTVGKSLIISRSKMGEYCLQKAASKGKIVLKKISGSQALHSAGSKKIDLRAKFFLNKLMGKRIPAYDPEPGRPRLVTYPYYAFCYLKMYLYSKHCLWRFLAPLARIDQKVVIILVKLYKSIIKG